MKDTEVIKRDLVANTTKEYTDIEQRFLPSVSNTKAKIIKVGCKYRNVDTTGISAIVMWKIVYIIISTTINEENRSFFKWLPWKS